jgi:hypothetical protein
MSADYDVELDGAFGAWMHVEFVTDRRDVTDYAVVLLVEIGEQIETVRVYDGAHGENEMHRYTRRGGKQAAEVFYRGTLGAGMRAAIEQITRGYQPMIEAWRRR